MSREALITPQPMPVPGERLVKEEIIKNFAHILYDNILEDCIYKMEASEKKYGSPLMTFNGRSAALDAYQDLLDTINYLVQEYLETQDIDDKIEIRTGIQSINRVAGRLHLWLELKGILTNE